MVDRKSPISLYYQIAMDLRQRIARGEWKVGQRLPSEQDLAGDYQVSRMTLRQALDYLELEGILARQRGLGTFIAADPKQVIAPVQFPISFSRQMRELGFSPVIQVIEARVIAEPAPELAAPLGLPTSDPVVLFKRLFLLDNQPVALSQSTLPHRLCPGIVDARLINNSLTTTLEKVYGIYPVQIDQWLQAARCSAEEASLLQLETGAAVLEINTRSQREDQTVIEYARTLCAGDRLALHIHVAPEDERSATHIEYVSMIGNQLLKKAGTCPIKTGSSDQS
jgi:DNA-binding GntR family transcriptional regulator